MLECRVAGEDEIMKSRYSSAFVGFIMGLSVVLLLGSTPELRCHGLRVSESLLTSISYQSSFSGINADGVCYLAITNAKNGQTDVFKISDALDEAFSVSAFQQGQQGWVIAVPQE